MSARRRLPAWIAAVAVASMLGACEGYVTEQAITTDRIIALDLVLPASGVLANGKDTVTLRVSVAAETAADKDIVVATSDGVLDFAADPDDAAARTLSFRVAPGANIAGSDTKVIDVPMVVGRRPGNVFVSASLVGVESRKVFAPGPALPDTLLLETSVAAMDLDGVSRADVTASLLRDQGEVSLGTRVELRVCCEGMGGAIADCPGRAPLRVPALAELERGRTVQVTAVAESIDENEAGGPTPFLVALIARAVSPDNPALSCNASDVSVARILAKPQPASL